MIQTKILFLIIVLPLATPAHTDAIPLNTIEDLQKIGNDDMYPLNGSYVITQDIDARGTASWNDGAGFDPIGEYNYFSSSKSFKGTLDGQGHVILGLNINRPDQDFVGMFEYVGNTGLIKNVVLSGGAVRGRYRVGALAAMVDGGTFELCAAKTYVSGMAMVGGLVGTISYGTIKQCHTSGVVMGDERYTGGLVGRHGEGISPSVLLNCYSRAAVSGGYLYTGGLAGLNAGVIQNSFAAGEVTADPDGDATGGFAGENSGVITACYWDKDITGQSGSAGAPGG